MFVLATLRAKLRQRHHWPMNHEVSGPESAGEVNQK